MEYPHPIYKFPGSSPSTTLNQLPAIVRLGTTSDGPIICVPATHTRDLVGILVSCLECGSAQLFGTSNKEIFFCVYAFHINNFFFKKVIFDDVYIVDWVGRVED